MKRIFLLGFISLLMIVINSITIRDVASCEATIPLLPERLPMTLSNTAPLPLPRSCISGSVPIGGYEQPICCVSGYVYLNGGPVAGAEVTISVNGASVVVTTTEGPGSEDPYFSTSLSDEPLNVAPGIAHLRGC